MSKILSKVLRNAMVNNGYIVGGKEVLKSIDKARLVILSNTVDKELKKKIEEACKSRSIPIYKIDNTSKELGRLCNKPFRVSMLSLSYIEDNDLEALLRDHS